VVEAAVEEEEAAAVEAAVALGSPPRCTQA